MTLCINQPNQLLRNDEHIWRLSFFSIAIEQSLQLHLRPLQGFLIIRPTNPVRSQQPLGTSQSMRNTDIHSSTQNVLWLRQAPNTIRTMYTYQTVHDFLWTFHSIFPPNASFFRSCGCCALVTMPLRIWLACKFSSTTFAYKDRRCYVSIPQTECIPIQILSWGTSRASTVHRIETKRDSLKERGANNECLLSRDRRPYV